MESEKANVDLRNLVKDNANYGRVQEEGEERIGECFSPVPAKSPACAETEALSPVYMAGARVSIRSEVIGQS